MAVTICAVETGDARFDLEAGAGTDAVHANPQYSYALTRLRTDRGLTGCGLAFTLGGGNDLVCRAIELLAPPLVGQEIEGLMAGFGDFQRRLADHPQLRWLGPHKGVVHLALSSITNACWDLWAKARGVPLWRLLLDLSPEALAATLDLRYLADSLAPESAATLLQREQASRPEREAVLARGYPGYDTSAGWFGYDDAQVVDNARRAVAAGFTALKLKVGSTESPRDIRRAGRVREAVGAEVALMFDANQQWTLPQAKAICPQLAAFDPLWIEEPTHPDDLLAHQWLNRQGAPNRIAAGEHLPNALVFKNYLQADALQFVQADAVRLAGVSEFLAVSLLARAAGKPVVPHVGDMGQIHQHLVLFNRIALGHPLVFLEHIPHLRRHFVHPATLHGGVYQTPQEPGASSDLIDFP